VRTLPTPEPAPDATRRTLVRCGEARQVGRAVDVELSARRELRSLVALEAAAPGAVSP
jgi:hypothetical protein